jgi:hypothetical protein
MTQSKLPFHIGITRCQISRKDYKVRKLTLRLALLVAISAVFGLMMTSGCGDKTLTLNVDILSFLDSTVVTQEYGDDPVIPPGAPDTRVISPPQRVNLSEGLGDITDVESVSLRISSEFVNETGIADVLFQVFMTDTLENPYDAAPYISELIHVEPGTIDTLHADVVGDETLGELFTGEAVQLGLMLRFDSSSSPTAVTGTATLTRFNATVVARRHIP